MAEPTLKFGVRNSVWKIRSPAFDTFFEIQKKQPINIEAGNSITSRPSFDERERAKQEDLFLKIKKNLIFF